jgi:hypothetical protein
VDGRLESMYRRFTWRILSNYVTPWEFEQLKAQITDYGQWCAAWSAYATAHVARGDEALAAGHTVTAGDAYLRSALGYHWASFVFTHDQAQFRAALAAMAAAWAKAAPLLSPPMEILGVPFGGLTLPGYLRLPAGVHRPPVVLLQVYGGSDPGSPPAHAERIAAEYGGPVTTVVYPDGVHILNNVWNTARPLVADWLADTL